MRFKTETEAIEEAMSCAREYARDGMRWTEDGIRRALQVWTDGEEFWLVQFPSQEADEQICRYPRHWRSLRTIKS